ncbi:MAG: hypothetical protein NT069_11665, partial [Planctomycetota bacterium]|nr:hypothetical protein [Planctomycetota bacterium]
MSEANDEQEVVLVKLTCAICHELMELEAHDAPRQVACPYCEREVTVPSRTQVQVLYPRVRHRSPDEIGDYGVTAPPEPPPVPRPTVAPPVGERLPARFATKIPCPQCKKLVGTRLEERPKRINCPECGAFVQVPARDAADPPVTRVDTKPRRPSQSSLESAPKPTPRPPEPVEDEPRSRATVFDQLSAVRVEAVPLPPRYTFLTGVFEFPWRRNSVVRWLYQSFGWLVLLCVLATMQTVASQYAQSMFGLVLAFFALPLIWIGFWSCSYAASNFLCVVEATAAGQDKIVEWPDPNWREWMIQLIYLLWIGAIPAILG